MRSAISYFWTTFFFKVYKTAVEIYCQLELN